MRDPLILPLAAVIAGILLGRWLPFGVVDSMWPGAAFLGLAFFAGRAGSRVLGRTCMMLALVFAGTLAVAWNRPGPPPEIDAGSKETVLLEGCVVEPTVFSPGREQFTLELAPAARARVSLALDQPDQMQKLAYGHRVEIEARVRPPHNFNNPGAFDYAAYLARRNIYWTAMMTRNSAARVLPGRCGWRVLSVIYALRTAALERLESLYNADDYNTGMMEAILIGETTGLERAWTGDFRRTGTFHALVISGVHVTVLAGVLLFLLRLCGLPQLSALAVTAAAAWLYALVSGFSAPVVRAAGGFTLFLIARFLFRRTRVMNLLAAVALVYLFWDPDQLFDASFQLSFLSVAAIGALAAPLLEPRLVPLSRGLRGLPETSLDPHLDPRVAQARMELRLAAETFHLWTRAPQRFIEHALGISARATLFAVEMLVISTVIQIGLALPMAEYFHRVSFTGLSANLLIVPLMEAAVPAGFFAIFTNWHWAGWCAGGLLKISARIASWHAGIEPSWRIIDPPLWFALVFAGALIVLASIAARPSRRITVLALAASVLGLFGVLLWQPWKPRIQPNRLELTSIDVGQGDSLLAVFPHGAVMLIDGGGLLQFGKTRRSNLDIGEDVVSPYLWHRGIRTLDVLVATHAHEDHIGGLTSVLDNFRPKQLWVGANPPPKLIARAARVGTLVIQPDAGSVIDFSGARIEILSPPSDYWAPKPGNNDSLAFRLSFGQRSFLLTGDMERPMEARLLSAGSASHTDVLKVGHHGSRTSTIQPFLDAVSPSVAVISAGFENSFGHPHPDVVRRLQSRGAAILRTDLDGLVSVSTDGRSLEFGMSSWQPAFSPFDSSYLDR